MIDLGDDLVGFFRPDEGLRIGVVVSDVLHDGGFEVGNAVEYASSDALAGDFRGPALDEVEP